MKSIVGRLLLAACGSQAISLDVSSTDSIKSAAKTIVSQIVSSYNSSSAAPGLFPEPYYFWQSGLVWDSLINYGTQTGDKTYIDLVRQALSFQVGPSYDYRPPNQTKLEGNDDQSFWALTAMTAAEQGFPAPTITGQSLVWAQLAENVFNEQVSRWDTGTCGGGLRWQIFAFNKGYNYKNSLTNGNFYQLAARLALYTGNATYSDWAQKALDWSAQVGLIDNRTKALYDGVDTSTDCSQPNHLQWTAAAGTYLSGAAYLQNYSSNSVTSDAPLFFAGINAIFASKDGILSEIACESGGKCNTDQLAYKAVLARALARSRDLTKGSNAGFPGSDGGSRHERMDAIIQASAKAAAAQCSGGDSGSVCGSNWTSSKWDGSQGLGQDLSALEMILATLPGKELRNANTTTPVAASNGTSSGDSGTTTGPANGTSGAHVPASTNNASRFRGSLAALTLAVGFAMVSFAA